LVLIGPEGRVFGASAEAHACGVTTGLSPRDAEIRCPEARLVEADISQCRTEVETLLQVLELASPQVEPHGWGAAYVDLGNLAQGHADAVALGQDVGRAVRKELSKALEPALGWDSTKFTAQAAARRTQPGHLLAVAAVRERAFLQPLPITLLPLPADVLERLGFLGLRTLGQYAQLPTAAVRQQFGRAGILAHRCAQGKDDRPVLPRWQAPHLTARREFDVPCVERERLLATLRRLSAPLLSTLRANLQACGQVRLDVRFDNGSLQERRRVFLVPSADTDQVGRGLEQLLDGLHWPAAAAALGVSLEQIQDAVVEQLSLFAAENERERKLENVQRHLAARFGHPLLRRAVLAQPGAPLPEWRIGWLAEGEP
jgi:nucleotidyltransferase/DNA polymerase involved in DNA repair